MEEFKVVCFWLDVILVLLYGCWFVDAKTVGKITLCWLHLLRLRFAFVLKSYGRGRRLDCAKL